MCNSLGLWAHLEFTAGRASGDTATSPLTHLAAHTVGEGNAAWASSLPVRSPQPGGAAQQQAGKHFSCFSFGQGAVTLDPVQHVVPGKAVLLHTAVEGPWAQRCHQPPTPSSGGAGRKAGEADVWVWSDAMLHVSLQGAGPSAVRTAPLLPGWHFDMLLDAARNSAYEAALRCAAACRR